LIDIEERGHDLLQMRRTGSGITQRGYNDIALRRQNLIAIWPPRRLEELGGNLPAIIRPEGPGYMPLYLAARWIATCGHTVKVDTVDALVWRTAFDQLLAQIASEQVTVTGIHNNTREKLSGHIFAGIQVELPFSDTSLDLLLSEELYLCSCIYIDEEHWQKGWNDRLETRYGAKWTKLMVLKSDIARHWTFADGSQNDITAAPQYRTGGLGRPSPMHLVTIEHRARCERGEAEDGVVAESNALSEWLQTKRRTPASACKCPKIKFRANFRHLYRAYCRAQFLSQ
jgi:hypothetical protein